MCQRRCRCTPSSAPPRRNVIGSQEYYQARGFPSLQNDNEAKPSLQHVVRRSEELQVFGRRSNVDIELVKEESEENKQVRVEAERRSTIRGLVLLSSFYKYPARFLSSVCDSHYTGGNSACPPRSPLAFSRPRRGDELGGSSWGAGARGGG